MNSEHCTLHWMIRVHRHRKIGHFYSQTSISIFSNGLLIVYSGNIQHLTHCSCEEYINAVFGIILENVSNFSYACKSGNWQKQDPIRHTSVHIQLKSTPWCHKLWNKWSNFRFEVMSFRAFSDQAFPISGYKKKNQKSEGAELQFSSILASPNI